MLFYRCVKFTYLFPYRKNLLIFGLDLLTKKLYLPLKTTLQLILLSTNTFHLLNQLLILFFRLLLLLLYLLHFTPILLCPLYLPLRQYHLNLTFFNLNLPQLFSQHFHLLLISLLHLDLHLLPFIFIFVYHFTPLFSLNLFHLSLINLDPQLFILLNQNVFFPFKLCQLLLNYLPELLLSHQIISLMILNQPCYDLLILLFNLLHRSLSCFKILFCLHFPIALTVYTTKRKLLVRFSTLNLQVPFKGILLSLFSNSLLHTRKALLVLAFLLLNCLFHFIYIFFVLLGFKPVLNDLSKTLQNPSPLLRLRKPYLFLIFFFLLLSIPLPLPLPLDLPFTIQILNLNLTQSLANSVFFLISLRIIFNLHPPCQTQQPLLKQIPLLFLLFLYQRYRLIINLIYHSK